ncbi:sulfatase [Natrinema sp. J7-2]|uniref:sulfatase n=1 Tax=Natrinema sp. (strain J7-2) TaxID=406552 RepID=UPI00026D42CA|nr:sulfatase [Natrinema sp. J7-2]AFO55400.1 sulfatase [Natrinema sp. J7-2]
MPSSILLSVDCLRSDHVGCYGYDRPTTPNIDSFATDATRYRFSYANCPGTRWAFQSIHTGVYAGQIDGLGIPDGYREQLAERFRSAGHSTFGIAHNGFLSRDYGYDEGFDRWTGVADFDEADSLAVKAGKRVANAVDSDVLKRRLLRPAYSLVAGSDSSGEYRPPTTDADVVDRAVEWLRARQSADDDYFAWVHFMDAHTPYGRYDEHLRAVRGDTDIDHVVAPNESDAVIHGEPPEQRVIDTYDACIRSVDEQLGRLLEVVDDDTVVAIVGDHGEEFGRYGAFHEASLYSSMTNVPIIVRAPGLEAGVVDDHFAQHVDIAPTLLAAADFPVPDRYVGEPLQRVTDRDLSTPTWYSLEAGHVGLQTDRWKVIQPDGERLGFEMDRTEREGDPTADGAVPDALHAQLDAFERRLDADRVTGGAATLERDDGDLSASVEENLSDLGYLE